MVEEVRHERHADDARIAESDIRSGRLRRLLSPQSKQWALVSIVLVLLAVVVRFGIIPGVAWRLLARHDRASAEAILRRFPSVPQAHESHRAFEPSYRDEDSDVVTGQTMTVEFRLPPDTTPSKVFSYYSARLPAGWRAASNTDCPPALAPTPSPGTGTDPTLASPSSPVPEYLERPATHRDFLGDHHASVSLDLARSEGGSAVILRVSVDPHGGFVCTSAVDGGPDPFARGFG